MRKPEKEVALLLGSAFCAAVSIVCLISYLVQAIKNNL